MIKLLLIFCIAVACNFTVNILEPFSEEYDLEESVVISASFEARKPDVGAGTDTENILTGIKQVLARLWRFITGKY
ncbi:MAG: hypothetical protein WCI57_04880 [Candidatus Berkelbacteria bacterium]